MVVVELGSGSGSSLPLPLLITAGLCTLVATAVSAMSIVIHLKNYRKPHLQRQVIRIMLMVPLYAIASFISLFSLEAAFFIDVIRDIYEAFVIYCFFDLLIAYLGGERSLLILLHGRPPKYPVFPTSLFWREVDVSDPYTFLFLKRGVIQYVQVKPILAVATVILKALGKYNEGDFRAKSGYLYISLVYNISICLALYCLAMFWMCVNVDLKPFRPMPKFLCVKGILFFSFWQSILVSLLVAGGAIVRLGPYTDAEHISLGLTDTLICLEMPLFAVAHLYAFSVRDFTDAEGPGHTRLVYAARLPVFRAARDAFGGRDVVEDVRRTLAGARMGYREFEPSEGALHQGLGRERRIRAGLRYSEGGRRKYWLPQPAGAGAGRVGRAVGRLPGVEEEVHAPLLPDQAAAAVHRAADLRSPAGDDDGFGGSLFAPASGSNGDTNEDDDGYALPFGSPDERDDALFAASRQYLFGDYNYPVIDVSSEAARTAMWGAEERILRDEHSAWFSPVHGGPRRVPNNTGGAASLGGGYGAVGRTYSAGPRGEDGGPGKSPGGREVVIDKETERLSPPRAGALPLRWTSSRASPLPSHTSSLSPSPSHSPAHAPAARPRISPHLPTADLSRSSSHSASASPHTPAPVSVRPDAVDLVVEDPRAAEERATRERRRGEPAVHGSLPRHVYRRVAEAEVEQTQPDLGREREQDASQFGIGEAEDAEVGEDEEVSDEMGVGTTIATVRTPPAHARIVFDALDEDNPWA